MFLKDGYPAGWASPNEEPQPVNSEGTVSDTQNSMVKQEPMKI